MFTYFSLWQWYSATGQWFAYVVHQLVTSSCSQFLLITGNFFSQSNSICSQQIIFIVSKSSRCQQVLLVVVGKFLASHMLSQSGLVIVNKRVILYFKQARMDGRIQGALYYTNDVTGIKTLKTEILI